MPNRGAPIGLYGANNEYGVSCTPLAGCCGWYRLAPSFLTEGGDGNYAGVKLWFNVFLHVFTVVGVGVANGAFFLNSSEGLNSGALGAMAGVAIAFQTLGVLGVVVSTSFFQKASTYPTVNGLGIGIFLIALVFNTLAYNYHLTMMIASEIRRNAMDESRHMPNVEEMNYPISICLQCWSFGSILANAFALSRPRDLDEDL